MADAALSSGRADAARGRFEALRACLAEPRVVIGGGFAASDNKGKLGDAGQMPGSA